MLNIYPTFTRCLVLAGTFAILSACTIGPDYKRPTMDVPASFKEMKGWKVAQPKDAALNEKWWELFSDPQLTELENQVVVSNMNIAAAEARFRQARASVQAARAGYFPTITIGAAETYSKRSASLGGQSSTTTDFSLPIDFSWEADIWGRIRRTVESSRASSQASAADLAAVRLSMQAELALDYFQLRIQDSQKQYLDDTVANFQKSLDLTRNRYASGVVARVDVLQAETQLKSTQAQMIDLGVQRAQLEHAIALLIGKPASVFYLEFAPFSEAQSPSIPTAVPSELLERRPDIAMAERRMAAANAQIGVTQAAYYPTIRLSASAGLEASSLVKWLTWPSRFWSVGPSISETLYDGGLRLAHNEQVLAAYDEAVASYRQAVLTGFQEVEDNLAALRILENEARVQDESVEAARLTVMAITNQYKSGIVGYLNVITAQTAELANKRTAIGIVGRRMAAGVLLIKALGGGWDAAKLIQNP